VRFTGLALVFSTFLVIGCSDDGPPTGSEGGPCYGNDTCDDDLVCSGSFLCVRMDPCLLESCSGHGTCHSSGGSVACVCDNGFRPVGLTCIDPCAGETCSGFGTCVFNGQVTECDCDPDYRAEGLECLWGEHALYGTFTVTGNPTVISGIPFTHEFDDVMGHEVSFVMSFNISYTSHQEGSDPVPFRRLIVYTGPIQLEITGPGATAVEKVRTAVVGQSAEVELTHYDGPTFVASATVTGMAVAETFGFQYSNLTLTLTVDADGYPEMTSVSPTAGEGAFLRYDSQDQLTDYASGDGLLGMD
jgi:hypothetical protein